MIKIGAETIAEIGIFSVVKERLYHIQPDTGRAREIETAFSETSD